MNEKTKVISAEIIVAGTKDKPYFEIKYKEVGKDYYNIGFGSYYLENVFEWREKYLEIVNEGENVHTENGWIPCSERLPDEEEIKKAYCRNMYGSEFIVMIEGATLPTTLYRTLDGFWVDERREIYKVIAWQPLPQPYKEVNNDEK